MHRQLGANEGITWSYQQLRPMHFIIVGIIHSEIHREELQRALEKAQRRHPLLNVKIALDESQNPWFRKDSAEIPIRMIEREDSEQWKREVEIELRKPFNSGKAPLIRVGLIQGNCTSEVILTCDHTISDGKSVLFLLKDILQYIGAPDQPVIPLPARQSYEKILAQDKSGGTIYSKLLAPKTRSELPENSQPRLHAWSLSELQTTTIIDRCRNAETSVHTAICAAFLLSLSELQDANKAPKCLTPIDIRRMIGVADDFGYYFTAVVTNHSITPNLSIWDLARSVSSQLDQKMAPSSIFASLPELEAFLSTSPSHAEVVSMLDLVNDHDILISNLGRVDIPEEYGELKLTGIYGPSLMSHMEKELVVGVMTFADRMTLCLTYDEIYFSHSEVDRLQEKAMDLLGVASCQKSLTS
jgi:Condensation domain